MQRASLVIDTKRGCLLPSHTRPDARQSAEGLYLYPGLINAHDHLELNHYPRSRPRPRYAHAEAWAADMSAALHHPPYRELRAHPLDERCWIGGLKNLLSGVTTVAHRQPRPYSQPFMRGITRWRCCAAMPGRTRSTLRRRVPAT
ncbi:MAG: hypothetical protein HC915_21545 [Anaerolineae bacterium]|nr:hypothetical protein [Anaerolineae bacterium]